MNNPISLTLVLLLAGIQASVMHANPNPPPGQGWIRQLLAEDPACDPEAIDTLAAAARQGIEREVGRRENSVKPPSSASELACLGDLMGTNLDVAFPTGSLTAGLPGFVQGILSQLAAGSGGGPALGSMDIAGLASSLAGGGIDPTRILPSSLCSFAGARWSQATLPALGEFGDLAPLAVLPALLGAVRPTPNFPQPQLRRRFDPNSADDPPRAAPSSPAATILGLGQ